MKQPQLMPSKCLICSDSLLNEFLFHNALSKRCFKLNHMFYCKSLEFDNNHIELISISFDTYKKTNFVWNFRTEEMYVISKYNQKTIIPWVEPDFSNPTKLLNKLNIYLKYI